MMMINAIMKEDSEEDKLLQLLAAIDVCKRCVVRMFKGTYGDYLVAETEPPVKRGSHCCACLGILEGTSLIAVAKKVAEKLEEVNYDSPTFQTGIAVPQCLILRQASIISHLIDHGVKGLLREFTNVKTVARFFLNTLIEKYTNKQHDPHSEFFIKLDFNYPADAVEISKLQPLMQRSHQKKTFGKRGNDGMAKNGQQQMVHSHESINKAVRGLNDMEVKKYATCPPNPLAEASDFNISMSHTSIFIGGRYNKYSRELSQTPWSVDGMRKGETSTLELIGEKLKVLCKATGMKFQSAGREDVDVRMLGKGRPFAVELTDPKITVVAEQDMRKLQVDINSSTEMIAVRDLQKVNRAGLELMKKGEEEKVKTYRAKLWSPVLLSDESIENINDIKNGIELHQKTPIRVLHRRPIRTRIRKIHNIHMTQIEEEEGHYEVTLKSQAGTYIKEFVHGDFGRTDPSLRTMLDVPIDIVELDVMSIDLDWPPEIDDELETVTNGIHAEENSF